MAWTRGVVVSVMTMLWDLPPPRRHLRTCVLGATCAIVLAATLRLHSIRAVNINTRELATHGNILTVTVTSPLPAPSTLPLSLPLLSPPSPPVLPPLQTPLLPRQQRQVAVCFVGELRSIDRTATSLRSYVLDAWDADGFVVALVPNLNSELSAKKIAALRAAFGIRLAATIFGNASILDPRLRKVLPRAPGFLWSVEIQKWRMHDRRRAFTEQLLNRKACRELVLNYETNQRQHPYSVYARVRLDSMFFAKVPPLLRLADVLHGPRRIIIVPTGDRWGAASDAGISDRMIVGGAEAFQADAEVWGSLLDNTLLMTKSYYGPPDFFWIMETLALIHFTRRNFSVHFEPFAYCTLGTDGNCRYPEHLLRASQMVPQLVQQQPWLCGTLGEKDCEKPGIPQTSEAWQLDPQFCGLITRCEAANHKERNGILRPHVKARALRVLGATATHSRNAERLAHSQLAWLCELHPRMQLLVNVYDDAATHMEPTQCCTFSHVRGHKPLFWKHTVTPNVTAAFDYVWLFDADIVMELFPLQQMLVAMMRTESQISQPKIAPVDSDPMARSSDWAEFRFKVANLACLVQRNPRVEVMTPIFTRTAWDLVHVHLLNSIPDEALAVSAWEIDTVWCALVQHFIPDKPACTIAWPLAFHAVTHEIERRGKRVQRKAMFNHTVLLEKYQPTKWFPRKCWTAHDLAS